jgi:hypothetical protein
MDDGFAVFDHYYRYRKGKPLLYSTAVFPPKVPHQIRRRSSSQLITRTGFGQNYEFF